MPGPGFSLPVEACRTGARLRDVADSVCSQCYAARGRFFTHRVRRSLDERLRRLDDPRWVEAMAHLIERRANRSGYFRWHDSGDIQSTMHLERILDVCGRTPSIKHWLPTREYDIVASLIRNGRGLPDNLTIRLSAHLIDGDAPSVEGLPVSTVTREGIARPAGIHKCPQPSRGTHSCGDCRACWDRDVPWVDYPLRGE